MKKKSKKKDASSKNKAQVPAEGTRDREERPFDFGGLPDRNLKKNLGC